MSSLLEVSSSYRDYAQEHRIEFHSDILKLPTGDGIAVVFTFLDLHNIALEFSLNMLQRIHRYNSSHPCERFLRQQWCDCHCSYELRIGLAYGKCILYRDINSLLNVAGNAINAANRVMNKADPGQILLTRRSYERLSAGPADLALRSHLVYIGEVMFKHGHSTGIWQYVDLNLPFVNSRTSSDLQISSHLEVLMARMDLDSIMRELDNMEWDRMHPNTASDLLCLIRQMLKLVQGGSEELSGQVTRPGLA